MYSQIILRSFLLVSILCGQAAWGMDMARSCYLKISNQTQQGETLKEPADLQVWGEWSNATTDGQRTFGFDLTVLRSGGKCFGLLTEYRGEPEGDGIPVVDLNCRKNQVDFSTEKAFLLSEVKMGPAEYETRFKGKILPQRLEGKLQLKKVPMHTEKSLKLVLPATHQEDMRGKTWREWEVLRLTQECIVSRMPE